MATADFSVFLVVLHCLFESLAKSLHDSFESPRQKISAFLEPINDETDGLLCGPLLVRDVSQEGGNKNNTSILLSGIKYVSVTCFILIY